MPIPVRPADRADKERGGEALRQPVEGAEEEEEPMRPPSPQQKQL